MILSLSECFDFINGGAWSESEYSERGIHVVKVTNLINGSIESRKDNYLPLSRYETYKINKLIEGDIVIATVGSHPTQQGSVVGRTSRVPKEFEGSFLNQNAVCLKNRKVNLVDTRYLYFVTRTTLFKGYIEGRAKGSANQVRMALGDLKKFTYDFPSLNKQKKIAALLSSYDDLIENNKRRIALLEKMAEEIYREWFVRFRFPGFRSAEFEKGIPKKWKTKTFRELVDYYIGGGWGEEGESPTFISGAYVIRGTDIPALSNGDYNKKVYRYHKSSNLKSRKIKANDFIFEVSGGSKDQLLGRNIMITSGLLDEFNGNVMCASFCKLMRFDSEQVSPFFMKYFLKLYYSCDLVGIYQVQSTGISNYQFESFLNYQTLQIPDESILNKFDSVVKPIIREQESLAKANLNLSRTKNLLLPRLISGKLSVEDLEIQFPPSMQEENAA